MSIILFRTDRGTEGGAQKSLPKGWWIENRLFTEWRLTWYGSGVTFVYIVVLGSLLLKGLWIIHTDGSIAKVASPVASGDTRSGLGQIGRLRRDGRRRSGTTGVSGETY